MNATQANKQAGQQLQHGHYECCLNEYRFYVFCPICREKIYTVTSKYLITKLSEHLQDEH